MSLLPALRAPRLSRASLARLAPFLSAKPLPAKLLLCHPLPAHQAFKAPEATEAFPDHLPGRRHNTVTRDDKERSESPNSQAAAAQGG